VNHDQRRAATKVLKLGTDRTPDDACVLCAFVKVQVVGSRERLYKDQQGRMIDLPISTRLEPPYGLRWPYDLQRRPACRNCKGGNVETINLQTGVKTRSFCQVCYGLGRQLRGDEFAQLCESCARYVYAWLEARSKAHMEKHMTAGGRLVVASQAQLTQMLTAGQQLQQRAPGLAKIGLPGIQR
jgi:hypothetical protein